MPLVKLGEAADVPPGAHHSLESFLETVAADPLDAAVVRLMPDDDATRLAPHLNALEVIEISFPRYADGRGYSQAQLLRRRLGYKGELRAVGDVLRDQLLFMLRSGFDSFEIDHPEAEAILEAARVEYKDFYQPAADSNTSVFIRRHS